MSLTVENCFDSGFEIFVEFSIELFWIMGAVALVIVFLTALKRIRADGFLSAKLEWFDNWPASVALLVSILGLFWILNYLVTGGALLQLFNCF